MEKITEKRFLAAFEIVENYKKQVLEKYHIAEKISRGLKAERFIEFKRNEYVEITSDNTDSKYFVKGARFKVLKCFLTYWDNRWKFDRYLESNNIEFDKNDFDLLQHYLIEAECDYRQILLVKLPTGARYPLKSNIYDYIKVDSL